jgi:protein ImuA
MMNIVMAESHASLARLKRRLARLERAQPRDVARVATGHPGVDAWLGGGIGRGRLHEIVAEESGDAAVAAGFGALLALRAGEGKPLLWLRTEAAERQGGKLYAGGLVELGIDGSGVVLGLVADDVALLKAANDAARCAGVGALLVEAWGDPRALDLTATRRLMLAAEASGVTVLLLRVAAREAPSVADTRWGVRSAPSLPLADGTEQGAPGHPAFEIELLRRRVGPAGRTWRVEWNRERRVFQEPAAAPLPGAVFPVAAG